MGISTATRLRGEETLFVTWDAAQYSESYPNQRSSNHSAAERGGKRDHHQAKQIKIRFNSRGCAFDGEDKGAQQIDNQQHSGRVVPDRASQLAGLTVIVSPSIS